MSHRDGTLDRRTVLYREVVTYIAQNHADSDLKLENVARAIAASPRQVQRVLVEIGGTSFTDVLVRARILTAAQLLADDGLKVKEIAARIGYSQPGQFAKTFRRHVGASPREYRARVRAQRGRFG